jgi:methylmalonyl-CoA carboxyltransferase 12S subunit
MDEENQRPMSQPSLESLTSEIAQLKQMLEAITQRLASMETAATAAPAPAEEKLSEETLLAIAAAVAAYLGHKPKIKQIRLIRSASWAQEGRVSIQASHRIAVQRKQ